MGSLHQLPLAANAHARLLESMVRTAIDSHPDEQVAHRWSHMAIDTLQRYAHPPLASNPVLDLDAVPGLDAGQRDSLEKLINAWMEAYLDDVRQQLMSIHRDLLILQKRVAECESGYSPPPP